MILNDAHTKQTAVFWRSAIIRKWEDEMKQFAQHSVFILITISYFCFSAGSNETTTDKTARAIVQKMDQLYKANSSKGIMEMEIITPHWQRTLVMKIWSEGMEKMFVRIQEPKKERGVASLKLGDEMWNYLPKTGKIIKIPPSMMMSSWMGSDFTNDDLVREYTFLEDYTFNEFDPEHPDSGLFYVECTPKEGRPILWGRVTVAVRKEDYLPVWQRFYDEKGVLVRLMNFRDITTFDDRKIPALLELIPQNEEGHKTIVRYRDMEFNVDISGQVFSLRNLRSQ